MNDDNLQDLIDRLRDPSDYYDPYETRRRAADALETQRDELAELRRNLGAEFNRWQRAIRENAKARAVIAEVLAVPYDPQISQEVQMRAILSRSLPEGTEDDE